MTQNKIGQLIILLFESKMKSYTAETVKIWVRLLKNYPEDILIRVIKEIIYSHEDFISIGMIHDKITKQPEIYKIALEYWNKNKPPIEKYDSFAWKKLKEECIKTYLKNYGVFNEKIAITY